jgi:hypothetical protein
MLGQDGACRIEAARARRELSPAMAKAGEGTADKRRNRTVPLGEAVGGLLGPALKRRGFASRDLVAHWAAMAPTPYDKVTRPEKLVWPRGNHGAEGAVLHLNCRAGHALALQHEGQRIAAAVNRYFGYVLVGSVRISPLPLEDEQAETPETRPALGERERATVARSVAGVADPDLREALGSLGRAIAWRR